MEGEHACVFCNQSDDHNRVVMCDYDHEVAKHYFEPSGEPVLYGALIEGEPHISINDDLNIDEVAAITAAFMDKIASFPQVRDNPMAILQAIQGAMMK